MEFSDRLAQAFAFAHDLHRHQKRKKTEIPYITHLMAVAALVGEFGGDEEQVTAALLHDAVEDQGGCDTLALVRREFGDTVANYVDGCTDAYTDPKPPWRERKEAFLAATRTARPELRLIVTADKLHNTLSMLRDYREIGEALWERFSAGRDGTLWYVQAAVEALGDGWDHPILRELAEAVERLRTAAGEAPSTRGES